MGRAATELSLQLLGGGHRLNPTNMHQAAFSSSLLDHMYLTRCQWPSFSVESTLLALWVYLQLDILQAMG